MGDILHALPAVAALRAAFPGAHIGWAVEPRWRPLLSPTLISQIHEVPTRDWKARPLSLRTLRQILTLRRDFRAARYDLAVDLQGSLRSAFLARLSGAPRVVGSAAPRETPARTFYTHRIALHQPSVIAQAAELLSAATRIPLTPLAPPIGVPHDHRSEAEVIVGEIPHILITPTAGWGAKQWPIQSYQSLTQRLEQAGHPVLINAGHAEDPTAKAIAQGTKAKVISTSLEDYINLTRRAALVIGGDTGPVHLAAALGIPTLALFGPTDPARNGPHFPQATYTILRHSTSQTDHRRHPATEPGLQSITVEEVYQAALDLLRP